MFNHEETIYFDEQNNRSHFLYVQCVCVYLFTTYKVPVVLPVAGNVIRLVSRYQFTCNNKVIDYEDQAVCGILKWN